MTSTTSCTSRFFIISISRTSWISACSCSISIFATCRASVSSITIFVSMWSSWIWGSVFMSGIVGNIRVWSSYGVLYWLWAGRISCGLWNNWLCGSFRGGGNWGGNWAWCSFWLFFWYGLLGYFGRLWCLFWLYWLCWWKFGLFRIFRLFTWFYVLSFGNCIVFILWISLL